MWLKIFLLSFYLFMLFLLSRIIEAFSYYQSGYLASHIIDPFTLSVRKLKAILDTRGVTYVNVIEKQELSDLVENSGDLTHGETTSIDLEALNLLEENVLSEAGTINFSCGAHFLERVEDTKDSVWLVQVLHSGRLNQRRKMNSSKWRRLIKHLGRFGIQAGTFQCTLDPEFCDKKGWIKDEIILAMPEGYCSKDKVTMKPYQGVLLEPTAVFDWINSELASRVQKVKSAGKLKMHWLQFGANHSNHSNSTSNDSCLENIRVLLLSSLLVPPMFFSALSAKFSGRVKFGIIDNESKEKREMIDLLFAKTHVDSQNIKASYLIITPEETRRFGSKHREHYQYKSLFSFLQSMHPEANDVFKISLIVISAASCFDLVFFSHLGLYKAIIGAFWSLLKWNLILIFCWMAMLGFFCSIHRGNIILDFLLSCTRAVSSSYPFNLLRSDWFYFLHSRDGWTVPLATLASFHLLLFFVNRKFSTLLQPSTSSTHLSVFWNIGFWETQISNLFQPLFAASSRSVREGLDIRDDDDRGSDYEMMEMFIERLAMPDLWLRPIISSQYLHDLPIWKHSGRRANGAPGSESDFSEGAEEGTAVDNECSGAESGFGSQPYLFICEKCRAALHPGRRRSPSSKDADKEARERQAAMRINSLKAAEYLMDGNYKCMCSHANRGVESTDAADDEASDGSRFREEIVEEGDGCKWGASDYQNGDVPRGTIASSDCSICLDTYKSRDVLCGLPCGHAYHQNCIMSWLTRDNHCCPVCRWPAYKAKPCHKHITTD